MPLGELLERFWRVRGPSLRHLSAPGAILAQHVPLTGVGVPGSALEPRWVRRNPVGRARGWGSTLKGIGSPCCGVSDSAPRFCTPCSPEVRGGLYTLRGSRRPYLGAPQLKPCSLVFEGLGRVFGGLFGAIGGSRAPLRLFLDGFGLLEASWRGPCRSHITQIF